MLTTGIKKHQDVTQLIANLRELLEMQFSLVHALDCLIRFSPKDHLSPTVIDMKQRLLRGESVPEVFHVHRLTFGDSCVALIEQAIVSGRLTEVLSEIEAHRKWLEKARSEVVQALWYPLLSLILLVGAGLFQIIYLVPKAGEFLTHQQIEMSSSTIVLLAVSDVLHTHASIGIAAASLLIFMCVIGRMTKSRIEQSMRLFIVKLVGLERSLLRLAQANYFYSLSSLMCGGVGIVQAMELSEKSLSNVRMRETFALARHRVELGSTLSVAVAHTGKLSPDILTMLRISETSGLLSLRLGLIGEVLLRRGQNTIKSITRRVVPLALLVVGGLLVWIIMAMFLPIYDGVVQAGGLI